MNFVKYLADRAGILIMNIIMFLIIGATMFMSGFGSVIIFITFLIWFVPLVTYIVFEYIRVRGYYKSLVDVVESIDKKYLIGEVVHEPSFCEGKIIYEIIREAGKSMNENVRDYKLQSEDYRDYIETWVHEIKTPLASSKLVIDNNRNEVTQKIGKELNKVDDFIEQVLYYSRSTDVSKDYIIKNIELRSVINSVIRSKSSDFINKRISIELLGLEEHVCMDEKWFVFIVNQIIQNSIKYSKLDDAKIKISSEKLENSIKLSIYDNGVGILEKDISRIFDKGFTGENGRAFSKSTGMGLYICKKLCDGLGINISINSKKGEFTCVEFLIPIGGISNFK